MIYTERIAIIPDESGYLRKEVRSLDKTRNEMAIKEIVGETARLSAGVVEGDPLFYAPEKWDGLLALMKRK